MRHFQKSKCMNWYKHAQIVEYLQKEAGWKENVNASVMAFIVMFLLGAFGSGISNINKAYRKLHVSEDEVKAAMQNPNIMEEAQRLASYYKTQGSDQDLINATGIDPKVVMPDTSKQTDTIIQQPLTQPQTITKTDVKRHYMYDAKIMENIIARTIYMEGAGESLNGKKAIASVIYTRGNGDINKMVGEILRSKQFSCWNDLPRSELTSMKRGKGKAWEDCLQIASSIMNGSFSPIIKANHYYNPHKANPSWAYVDRNKSIPRPFKKVDNHHFLFIG